MTSETDPKPADSILLNEASASLLGYFVHTWFEHYLSTISESIARLSEYGIIANLSAPTERGRGALFDFGSLDEEKLRYLLGIYFHILSSHKSANYDLMRRNDGKQVLFLRGYDLEGAVSGGEGVAAGFSTVHTEGFGGTLEEVVGQTAQLFKVLSPKDVYWDTVATQRFFRDYDALIRWIRGHACGVYLHAQHWREGVLELLDRMDHYVVYVSSIGESVLWELEQLDTAERRGRVTVVLDEEAIERSAGHLRMQEGLQQEFRKRMRWVKHARTPTMELPELREWLVARFRVVSPDDFRDNADEFRSRIQQDTSTLPPGERETWIDFRFHPAMDDEAQARLRASQALLQGWIDRAVADGIESMPLLVLHLQLQIYQSLLFGEHDRTGRALAAYAGVIQAALDFYEPEARRDALSPENRDGQLAMLHEHLDLAEYAGRRLLAYGKSHEFDDYSAAGNAAYDDEFARVHAAAGQFFDDRGGPLPT